jgi:HD-GYP domain-containing protein (c-di-GMP phosphodiesterase class II)
MDGQRERVSGRWIVPASIACLLLGYYRRAKNAMLAAEVQRLSRLVVTDPLTELRNHRSLNDDLAQEMELYKQAAAAVEDEHHRTLAGALALAVDKKDASTRSHSQAVSTLCAVIETELGFQPDQVARIRLAGLLHDVGKIGIPDAILQKPTKLNAEEYEQMKTHSVLGHDIVQAADMPIEANWVRHHHERIDGGGYPDGLAGQDIPLESRIIHVADAFEAMTSDRPYRVAPGEQFAVQELQRNVDTQFDSGVVAALLRVLDHHAADAPIIPPSLDRRAGPQAARGGRLIARNRLRPARSAKSPAGSPASARPAPTRRVPQA